MEISGLKIKAAGKLVRIARPDADKFIFLPGDPEPVIQGLRKCHRRVDIFTFMELLPAGSPRYPYPMEWDNLAAIRITSFDEWWTAQLGFKARNKAKQASKKGVELREVPFSEELAREICEIYSECPIRQGRRFPHYGKTVAQVYAETATYLDCSTFIGAFFQGKMIGFIKIVFDPAGTQAGLMNIVSLISHRDKAPTNALVAEAVRCCAARGVSYLTYSNFSYGRKQQDTLSDFKERNGFQRLELPRYFVPLTPLGQLALRLGLHHDIKEHIPQSVSEKLRKMREAWYSRRYPSVSEAS